MSNTPQIRFAGFTDAWEQCKLGDYCDMYNGDRSSKYPNVQDMVSDGIPFINAGDLENGRVNLSSCNKISKEKYDDLGGAKLQLGDIVYCLRGTLGKNAYIDNFTEGTVASSLVAIRPKNINGRYMFHVINSDIEYRQRIVHDEGAAQPNLSAKNVSEFLIPIPNIDEQKMIAKFLDNLTTLITLHQRKCNALQKFKKSMLQKMFPQNGESVPEIRFAGFTDAWEQRKVGELTVESSEYTTLEAGFPLLTSSRNGLIYQNEYRGKQTTDSTETMFSIVPLGACTYRHMSDDDVFHLNVNRLEKGLVSREYPVFYASDDNNLDFIVQQINSSAEFRSFCAEQKKGGTRTRLYYKNLCEFQMLVPNTEEQEKIATLLLTLDTLITLHQRKLEQEKEKKKALMQLLLTGKVRCI